MAVKIQKEGNWKRQRSCREITVRLAAAEAVF
jgi:hypothetical protein